MASKQPPASDTLAYFDRYDYPLTKEEINLWSSGQSKSKIEASQKDGYYFLAGREDMVNTRKRREKISRQKWAHAHQWGSKLKKFPTIKAVFVTGSLAMNNAEVHDDIDLMIVTSVNSLWITRGFVDLYLKILGVRRLPPSMNHEPRAHNRVCDNLWLDESALHITPHDLYRAHEVLQAKLLWDRDNIQAKFLQANAWVKNFLPNAFKSTTMNYEPQTMNPWLWPINLIFYLAQYLYMRPKMTSEKVSLHSAFFHPKKN